MICIGGCSGAPDHGGLISRKNRVLQKQQIDTEATVEDSDITFILRYTAISPTSYLTRNSLVILKSALRSLLCLPMKWASPILQIRKGESWDEPESSPSPLNPFIPHLSAPQAPVL